jgi:hypothetical protein
MSVVDTNQIDGLAQVGDSGNLVVLIVDPLAWIVPHHTMLLEKKINTALWFVQSGQIYQKYPNEKQRVENKEIKIVFQLVLKYSPDSKGTEFLNKTKFALNSVGIELECILKNIDDNGKELES